MKSSVWISRDENSIKDWKSEDSQKKKMISDIYPGKTIETDVLVIGSGAGGAITASILAQSGIDVTLVEEGASSNPEELSPYSTMGMARLYRQHGVTPIIGKPNI